MTARLIRIGNSRGVRIPKRLIDLYQIGEGDVLELEERREGILLRTRPHADHTIGYADSYAQMAADEAETLEWADWDEVAGDGTDD